jgi:hypothetical protein
LGKKDEEFLPTKTGSVGIHPTIKKTVINNTLKRFFILKPL